jgi:hypothetical protein
MGKTELNPKISEYLNKKLDGQISENTIPSAISRIRKANPSLTLNAAAELLATKYGLSVQRFFNDRDRDSFKTCKIEKVSIKTSKIRTTRVLTIIAKYDSTDKMLKAHLEELNKTYTHGCYTSTFIICRKIMENLLIHHILLKKYPANTVENKEKYLDTKTWRFLPFNKILTNLRNGSNDFVPKRQLVERICDLAGAFKDDANSMTHSWYHLATKAEIDGYNIQQILDLILELEQSIS